MNVLVIAPHPDDEILGAGGTIAKRAAEGDDVYVCVVTKGCEPLFRVAEMERSRAECRQADRHLGVKETIFLDFPAAMLETVPRHELNRKLLDIMRDIVPDEVYIPHRGDMQLDHKMIVDATMVALRPKYEHAVHRIYAYETLSETGWDVPNVVNEFIPTAYSDISNYLKKKIEALSMFTSQIAPYPNARSLEAVRALAMFRGATMCFHAAEAFVVVREIIG